MCECSQFRGVFVYLSVKLDGPFQSKAFCDSMKTNWCVDMTVDETQTCNYAHISSYSPCEHFIES